MNEQLKENIGTAAQLMKTGAAVVYPTETVYGIGCDPLNAAACQRIRDMKGRDGDKPMLLLASSIRQVADFAGTLEPSVVRLAERFWPGALTMIIRPSKQLPPYLFGPGGGAAFRVTTHPEAAILSELFGGPIISTSANISGEAPVQGYEEALAAFGDAADMVLGNETPMGGIPSTLLDTTGTRPQILREGAVNAERIEEVLTDVFGQ